jgi:arabinogalactan oligomer / maltooligosaccharide transport system substrate-binding protein
MTYGSYLFKHFYFWENSFMSKFLFFIFLLFSFSLLSKDVQVEPEQDAIITVWESGGKEGDFIKWIGQKYEKKYAKFNVKVKFSPIELTKIVNKMQIAVQGGHAADVFVLPHSDLGQAINAGIVMPNLVCVDYIRNNFIESAVNASIGSDGKFYGFPLSIETIAMFYNKKLLKKPPQTFEELIKIGTPFTNRDKNQYGLYFDMANFYYANAFFAMEGGYVFGNNGFNINDIGLNSAGSVKGLEDILTLKPICVKIPPGKDQADSPMIGLFSEGKVMAIITGSWDITRLQNANVDFAIIPLPTFKGMHPLTFSGLRLMAVNPSSKYKKAAQLFAEFCMSKDNQKKRFEITKQIPVDKSLINIPGIKNNPLVKPFMEQAKYSKPTPAIPEMKLVWDPMIPAVIDAWTGKMTPKAALDNAVKTIKDQIELQTDK